MVITIFEKLTAPAGTPGTDLEVTWDELKELFEEPEIVPNKKQAACAIFGKTKGNLRGDKNVESRGFAVLDFDGKGSKGISSEELDTELDKLDKLEVSYLIHSTFSSQHATTDRYKVRIIIPLIYAIPVADWLEFAQSLMRMFPNQDPSVKNPERVFFMPAVANEVDKGEYFCASADGKRFASPSDFFTAEFTQKPNAQNSLPLLTNVTATETLSRDAILVLAKKLKKRSVEKDIANGRRLIQILNGEAFAPIGERHITLINMLGFFARHFPTASNKSITDILSASTAVFSAESVANTGQPIIQDAEYQSRELDKFRLADAIENEERRIRKEKETQQRLSFQAALDAKRATPTKSPEASATISPTGLYSPAELEACRRVSGATSDEELEHRWIVYFSSGSCAFLHPWGYSKTYGARVAGSGFRNELLRAGLDMTDNKGNPISIEQARERYGFLADKMIYSLSSSNSYWDEKRELFVKAVAPLADDLSPEFKPEWDMLLNLMAGDKVSKLKDWLACATRTDRPIAALYVDATQGAGKGLLVNALCALWKNGRAMPFSGMSKAFQYFDSPLVTINEGLDQKASSEILRRVIGDVDMRISQKFEPDGFLEGCVRVIVTANNPDVLSFGKEIMTLTDQVATAKRIVVVEGERTIVNGEETSKASLYLAEMARTDGLTMEARARSFASHIAWLTKNHAVVPGKRFLVEGDDKKVVDNIVTGTWNGDRLCEMMAEYINDPSTFNGDPADLARICDGELQLTARFFSLAWEDFYADGKGAPSPIVIGKTLKSLCVSQLPQERVSVKNKNQIVNFWRVDTAKLENWCKRSDHMTVEALHEALSVNTKNAKIRKPALEKVEGGKINLTK